jgi:hypothetical protein
MCECVYWWKIESFMHVQRCQSCLGDSKEYVVQLSVCMYAALSQKMKVPISCLQCYHWCNYWCCFVLIYSSRQKCLGPVSFENVLIFLVEKLFHMCLKMAGNISFDCNIIDWYVFKLMSECCQYSFISASSEMANADSIEFYLHLLGLKIYFADVRCFE